MPRTKCLQISISTAKEEIREIVELLLKRIRESLADEVLSQNMPPGSTVEVDKAPEGDEDGMKITITKPARKREAVGVGAEGRTEGGGEGLPEGAGEDAPEGDLPDAPDVLPDVPDAQPAPEGDGLGDPGHVPGVGTPWKQQRAASQARVLA